MNILRPEKKLAVLNALVEGCSIRSTSRLTGVHKTTILKLLIEAIEQAFGLEVYYAQLIKVYEAGEPGMGRYSPP